jgi:hypothetical protein
VNLCEMDVVLHHPTADAVPAGGRS